MKKIILFIIGIIIISNLIAFIINESSHSHEISEDVADYEQQLMEFNRDCKPLECNVIASFNRLHKKEYAENIKSIAESIRPILACKNGPKIGLAILNLTFESGDFTHDEQLYFLDKIATLKSKDNDLFGMIDPILSYIKIANETGDEFKIATGELSLALVISYFRGYDFSNEIIESIIYSGESSGWFRLKNQAMVTLAENKLALGKPQEALKSLALVDKNGTDYSEEDWRDYDIFTRALKSEAYGELEQFKQADDYLMKAKSELEKDKSRFLLGKDTLISMVEFQLAFKQKKFSYIEEKKQALLTIVDKENQNRYAKIVYSTLFDYYRDVNNITAFYDTNNRYSLLMEKRQSENYQLLILNKLKQSENDHLNNDNKKSMLFLKISFITLIIISTLLLITIVKIKYLNIENFTDPLTRCLNRRKFMIDYDKAMESDHGFLILDIDNFKAINDNFGHDIGDDVLSKVASVLNNKIGNKYQCYRIGGEEFVVIFNGSDKESAIKLSEDIRQSIEKLIWSNGMIVTISGGLSFSNMNKNTYKSADVLLYKAKRGTKNIIVNDV